MFFVPFFTGEALLFIQQRLLLRELLQPELR